MRSAALIYGPHSHHLDHLGPLCQMLDIPLFVTDEEILQQAIHFYPAIDARLHSALDIGLTFLQEHEVVFSCFSKMFIDELFFFAQHALRKKIFPIWCPHGNSDKGHKSRFMHFLSEESAALVYGPKMLDFFKECGVLEHLGAYVMTGNYRAKDYRLHQEFYDRLAVEHVQRKLPKASRTFLFAPTWQDSENSSSFQDACELLIKNLPPDTNLIIKLHPNALLHEEWKIDLLEDQYEGHDHVLFLHRYPHIYSLLSLCDLYIGDMSSIGYDFLLFDKPMVFLNQHTKDVKIDPGAYLFRCGITLSPLDYPRVYALIDDLLPFDDTLFSTIRKEVYEYTFGETKSPETLRFEIRDLLDTIDTDDLNLM